MSDQPNLNPGGAEAVQRGCLCPVLDNHHGRIDPRYSIRRLDCPLHGDTPLQRVAEIVKKEAL